MIRSRLAALFSAEHADLPQQALEMIRSLADPTLYGWVLRNTDLDPRGTITPGPPLRPDAQIIALTLMAEAPDPEALPAALRPNMIWDLNLDGLGLTALPEALGQWASLRSLSAVNNHLSGLPDGLQNLVLLDLAQNDFAAFPPQIMRSHALRALSMTSNRLTAIPDAIHELGALELLFLDDNRLARVPDSIGQLTALRLLSLGRNALTDLPDTIGQLQALRSLEVGDNALTTLPATIGALKRLKALRATGNQIRVLSEEIAAFPALTTLDLSRNPLHDVPEGLLPSGWGLVDLRETQIPAHRIETLRRAVPQARIRHLAYDDT